MKIKVTGQCPQRARRLHGHSEVTTKGEKRNGKPRQACVKSSTSTFEVSGGRPVMGHARVMEHDRADRLADDAAITSGLRLRGFEMLKELETQSQRHHAIDRLEERGRERGMSRRSSRKGRERAVVSQTNVGAVSVAILGKLPKDSLERIWAFLSA